MTTKNVIGTIDSWMAYDVRNFLASASDKEVRLIVTSQGGNVSQAIAISDMIAKHGNVTVEFSGLAASAATWMAFAAKKVVMHDDTLWLCHQSSAPVVSWENMNADELETYIQSLQSTKKSLEVIDAIIAKKYLDRCGKNKSLKDVCDLMKEERYLAPADVLEWGFVDEILPSKTAKNLISDNLLNELSLPKANIEPLAPANTVDEDSLFNRIMESVKNLFKKQDPTPATVEQGENHNNYMNKNYSFVNALLSVEGLTCNESGIILTEEQMKTLENRLAEADKAEKAIDGISDKLKGMSGLENKVNALSLIVDHLPAVQSPVTNLTPASEGEETITIDGADEVNEYLNQYKK